MKFVGVLILILLLMTQAFSNWFLLMAFKLNQEYIASNLCENRYRPQLNCNGNCVLMKKMKEAGQKEQNAPSALKIEISPVFLSSVSYFETAEDPVFISIIPYFTIFSQGKPIDRAFAFFHPPAI